MSIFNLNQRIKSFRENCSGNIAMMTALLGTTLFTAAGVAIDYSRAYSVRSEMTSALDSAVLAVGQELMGGKGNQASYRETFENFFFANMTGRGRSEDIFEIAEFSADPVTGEVKAVTKANIGASMMRIAGFETLEMTSESSSVFSISEVEVAMMLDVTGSMGGSKISDLRAAASDAVDILIRDGAYSDKVRVGLVPYSASVNAGNSIANRVTNSRSRSCVSERSGAQAFTDASYRDEFIGAKAAYCPRNAVVPLTARKDRLKNEIRRFRAAGSTAGHLGVAWSYYMLSDKWADVWPNGSKPKSYAGPTQKIAILMTDGIFNTIYTPGTDSDSYAIATCNDMKSKDIKIYSVAFKAPTKAENTLRACANANTADTTFYYSADSGRELRAAFAAIAADISKLRISR